MHFLGSTKDITLKKNLIIRFCYFVYAYISTPNFFRVIYSYTLNKPYIEKIHQMLYSSLFDNGILQIFSFLIKWLNGAL